MQDNLPKSGAEALVGVLKAAGVRCIFSLSGNQIMPVYDALIGSDIRLVHVRHEAAAVYMAEAWAQLTGEIGVALVTAGAGLGNALGAVISARASETPVLLLSGDSPRAQDGMGAFQELDQAAMSAPVVKHAHRATSADALGEEVAQAMRIAQAGRPGPVHLALPADVVTDAPGAHSPVEITPHRQLMRTDALGAVTAFLRDAEAPLVLTGPALSATRAGPVISSLQAAISAPVLCMESPRGLRDPALGALAEVTRQADRILLLGKSPDFTTGFLGGDMGREDARFAMIDPDQLELDRAHARLGARLEIAVQADALPAARALAEARGDTPARDDWRARVAEALARRVGAENDDGAGAVHPARLGAVLSERLARMPDTVLICDGGEFGQWMQAMPYAGARVINGVSGAIGAAPAYAIAASLARPEAQIVTCMGDGTAGFLLAEYETAAREGARFVAIIGNDHLWNAEHQIQLRSFGPERTFGCDLSAEARYDQAAAALGARGAQIAEGGADALRAALEQAFGAEKPVCLDIAIQPAPAPVVPIKSGVAEPVH